MSFQRPYLIAGVVNVTPDSFSDGGLYLDKEAAVRHALDLVQAGADILDIGGESTRPGSLPVSCEEEQERVLPVIASLKERADVTLSIDTSKSQVAKEALKLGCTIVNDVTAGRDPKTADLVREFSATIVLMHKQGTPQTMQKSPSYPTGVVNEVACYLKERTDAFVQAGVAREKIWVDPGIGFGKTFQNNLELLRDLKRLDGIADRVMVGVSRKAFLSALLKEPEASMESRLPGGLSAVLWAYSQGATVFRVHDVAATRRALETWRAIQEGGIL